MANTLKRLFVGSKIKTIGNYSLFRFEDEVPTEGITYSLSYGKAICEGFTGDASATNVVIAHVFAGVLVTYISSSAFSGLPYLYSVTIPDTITVIDSYAFSGCSILTSMKFLGTVAQWNNITKAGNWNVSSPKLTVVNCSDGDVQIT